MNTVTPGLMMDFPLTTQHLLRRMSHVYGSSRIVSVTDADGSSTTRTFDLVAQRANRLAGALRSLGVVEGDRVGTFAWNHAEHLETYHAVMGMGAVLHTINLRLHPDQIIWTARHAKDRVILLDGALAAQFAPLLESLPEVEHVIIMGDLPVEVSLPGAHAYEDLLAGQAEAFDWPTLNEYAAASLCYTSGTTGDPKGVLYSHRSIALHSLIMAGTEVYRITSRDVVLSAVPMFHVMGWGLPFVAGVVGCDLVLPGPYLQPRSLARVIRENHVTWTAGVPTIWMDLLSYVEDPASPAEPSDLKSLRKIVAGGTQVPVDLMRKYEAACGATMIQGWGMTEIFPGATMGQVDDEDDDPWRNRSAAGRLSPFYEARAVDAAHGVVPRDGVSTGELEVRGPCVAGSYYEAGPDASEAFNDGWLRTGDVGTIDEQGWIRITDRAKDAIKSGGEWISSVDLEIAIMAHPLVREAAVVGRPDPKWSERPYAYVVTAETVAAHELKEFLSERVARWWIPDQFEFVEAIPRTSTGKFDKKQLRGRLAT